MGGVRGIDDSGKGEHSPIPLYQQSAFSVELSK